MGRCTSGTGGSSGQSCGPSSGPPGHGGAAACGSGKPASPCSKAAPAAAECPLTHFKNMIPNCLAYAQEAKAAGRPVVGIMCEYTPRELIMAAGAVPVCLCGGSAKTIADAEKHLPANLCPLIKSTFGYHAQKSNPFLEMADLIVAETTCDGKKKMYEVMARSRPMYVLELPQKENDPDAREHWKMGLEKLRGELDARFAVRVTDDNIREAISLMNAERSLRRDLAALMKADDPPITGRQLIDLKSSISCIPADLDQYRKALAMFSGKSAGRTGRPVRVLMTGVPMAHGAERVLEIIENSGGLVVCMENCTGVKPVLDDVDESAADPIQALADKYFALPCSVMTPNTARIESLERLVGEYRPDCVIELVWQACLTYDVESERLKILFEQKLALPYLKIETDYSQSDSARIALRVEALFETVKERKSK